MDDEKDELGLVRKMDASSSRGNGNEDDDDAYSIEVLGPEDETLETAAEADPGYAEASSAQVDGRSKLSEELIGLRKEKDEIYDRLLRKHAEFENYRKRAERDKREFQQYALTEFMSELLLILDNFERALSHSSDQSGPEYRKGVELIYRQLRDAMEKKGLRPIEAIGKKFDPNFHEAISREERKDLPDGTVLEEFQKGYFYRDRLLRPSMVKVSYNSSGEPGYPGGNGEARGL